MRGVRPGIEYWAFLLGMTNDNQAKADTSLQEKLKAAASPEAAIKIAKDAGFLLAPLADLVTHIVPLC